MERKDLAEIVKLLQPKTVVMHHFDRWRLPLAGGLPGATMGRARRVSRDMKAIDRNIKVVIPKYFESHVIEWCFGMRQGISSLKGSLRLSF